MCERRNNVTRILRCERARMCEKLTRRAVGGVGAIERVRMIEWLRRAQLVYDPSGSLSCRHPEHRCRTEYINLFAARPPSLVFRTPTRTRSQDGSGKRRHAHAAAVSGVRRGAGE